MKISFNNPAWVRIRATLKSAPSLVVIAVLILYPLTALFIQIIFPSLFDYHTSWRPSFLPLFQVFEDQGNVAALLNSLVIGLGSALIATIIGTVTAFGSQRAPRTMRLLLDLAVWLIFFAPSYVIAQGWLILMQSDGILAQLFNLPPGWSNWFFTPAGLIAAMSLRYFPFVHLAMTQAIANVGDELSVSARMLGAGKTRIFWRITLPLLAPALMAGASIAFAEGFGDFGFAAAITPQMQIPLLSYQIYSALNEAPVNYSAAAGLSLLLVAVTAVVLVLQFRFLKTRNYATLSTHTRRAAHAPQKLTPISAIAFVIALLAIALPLGATICASLWRHWANGVAASNWSVYHYAQALQNGSQGLQALSASLAYAAIAAGATMLLGLVMALQAMFGKSLVSRAVNVLTIATIAVPGLVLAAGFVFAWNADWLIPIHLVLYGTAICLDMAYIAGSLPYAIRLQIGALSQVSANLFTAAKVLGAKNARVIRVIILPLVDATVVSTFFLTFTGVLFELPASSLLYPAGSPPLPVLIASKFNAFEWSQGSALTVIGMAIVLSIYGLGRYFVARLLLRRDYAAAVATQAAGPSAVSHSVQPAQRAVGRAAQPAQTTAGNTVQPAQSVVSHAAQPGQRAVSHSAQPAQLPLPDETRPARGME